MALFTVGRLLEVMYPESLVISEVLVGIREVTQFFMSVTRVLKPVRFKYLYIPVGVGVDSSPSVISMFLSTVPEAAQDVVVLPNNNRLVIA